MIKVAYLLQEISNLHENEIENENEEEYEINKINIAFPLVLDFEQFLTKKLFIQNIFLDFLKFN